MGFGVLNSFLLTLTKKSVGPSRNTKRYVSSPTSRWVTNTPQPIVSGSAMIIKWNLGYKRNMMKRGIIVGT